MPLVELLLVALLRRLQARCGARPVPARRAKHRGLGPRRELGLASALVEQHVVQAGLEALGLDKLGSLADDGVTIVVADASQE